MTQALGYILLRTFDPLVLLALCDGCMILSHHHLPLLGPGHVILQGRQCWCDHKHLRKQWRNKKRKCIFLNFHEVIIGHVANSLNSIIMHLLSF